ncbi:Type II secretion system (T2SS), protein F [anaerobic digester metagenome]
MVFDGFKKFFNRIGGITVDSSKKVGEGVSAPVNKLSNRRSEGKFTNGVSETSSEGESRSSKRPSMKSSSLTEGLRRSSTPKRSKRTIERMRMDKDEIEIFKELVDKKYERGDKAKEAKAEQAKKASYTKASLEELLKEEEKEGLDPKLIVVMGAVSFAVVVVIMVVLGFGIEMGLVFGVAIFMMALLIIFLPNIQKGKRSNEASRELPYALRQMSTELKAGIGLHDSMRSVAMSGYGALSEEFARTLEEIKYGETTEKALMDMSDRIQSEGLKRAVHQITRTLSSGGDLSKTLNVIAEDTSYEMRMKLKDYAQKLNSFTMIYMFVAILGPVICMIMLIAASTVMGPFIPPILLLIMYLFLFPMVVAFMAFMIKRLEPQI